MKSTKEIDKTIGRSFKDAIKLRSYGEHMSLVIGTPSLNMGHAIRLTPTLSRKIREALEKWEESL